jgi:uncharacterized protein (TIGR02246 family)
LSPDAAILHLWSEVRFPDSGSDFESRVTEIVVREGERWLVAAAAASFNSAPPPLLELPGIRAPEDDAVAITTWPASSSGAAPENPRPAIERAVVALKDAYNKKDGRAIAAAFFIDDADFVTAPALWWRGREEIGRGLDVVLGGPFASMTWLSDTVQDIRTVAPGVAAVLICREAESTSLGRRSSGSALRIMGRQGGQWRIIALHNGGLPPPPEELEPELGRILETQNDRPKCPRGD